MNGTPNLDVTLNAIGNITAKGGLTYTYTGNQTGCTYYTHTQPRAVRKIGSTVYCYDKNGNMVKRGGSNISYSSYNLPTTINAGSNSSTLSYGAFRNRYKQVAVSSGATETTIYAGGLFERVTLPSGVVEYRHYIPGGQGMAAIHTRRSTGVNSTYYWHSDHLGSPELFTDNAGAALVRPSFGAYGERRDGTDWSGPPSAGNLTTIAGITRRGFTGHEHLDSVGLIHMNGRVYDPAAGRFLSNDPVRTVGLTQDANPYSYAWNNPLTVLDLNGFCEDPITGEEIPCPLDPVYVPADHWDECDWGGPWMAGWSENCTYNPFLDSDDYVFEDEGGGGGTGESGEEADDSSKDSDKSEPQPNGCQSSANSPLGVFATNVAFRANRDPSTTYIVDASELEVRLTSEFNSRGLASARVQGGDYFVHGTVQVERDSSGEFSIVSEPYDFLPHNPSMHGGSLIETWSRNLGAYAGFYVATFGGMTEYFGGEATNLKFDFTCSPKISD